MQSEPLDVLIQRVREEADAKEHSAAGAESDARPIASAHRVPISASFDELLTIGSDEAFVERAYQAVLHRSADPSGRTRLLACLAAGQRRTRLIAQLQASPEARAHGARLPGIGLAMIAQRLADGCARLRLGRVGRSIERAYSGWRQLRLVLNGQGVRRLRSAQELADFRLSGLEPRTDHLEHQARALEHAAQLASERLQRMEQRQGQAIGRLLAVEERLDRQEHGLSSLARQQAGLGETQQQLRQESELQRARLNRLAKRPPAVPATLEAPSRQVSPSEDLAGRLDAYYLAFEEAHRGSETEIRQRLSPYLSQLAHLPEHCQALPVVDVGCGRGEWLRLLADQEFVVQGIDLNAEMVAHCRAQGLPAEHADALAWLAQQAEGSCAAVTAFHLVEHLPFEVLFPLVEQAFRVLAPGGLLILETPNPENLLVGSHTFYHDFSHRNPVTPTALQFLVGYHGFAVQPVLRLHPYPPEARVADGTPLAERVNGHFYGPQDYALIARKPLPVAEAAP